MILLKNKALYHYLIKWNWIKFIRYDVEHPGTAHADFYYTKNLDKTYKKPILRFQCQF